MSEEERLRRAEDMQALDARIARRLRQARTAFWKTGVATLAADGIIGGAIVGLPSG